jgi:hypothetical protein
MVPSSAKSIEWSNRLDRFTHSGLSLAQFCKQENIGVQSFYYWKKRLAPKDRQRSLYRLPGDKPELHEHDWRVRCTVHAGAIRIECHIESLQAFSTMLDWVASLQDDSPQGSSPHNTSLRGSSLFEQLVGQD